MVFRNHICAEPQTESDVRIVEVIGRANYHIINVLSAALQFFQVPVESLEFCKKIGLRKMAVNDAYRIIGIVSGQQLVTGVFDGAHVAGRYKAGRADKGKIHGDGMWM
jgi:hypothetical protein